MPTARERINTSSGPGCGFSSWVRLAQSYLNAIIGQQVMRDLRLSLCTHLQDLSLRFYTTTPTGEILSRLTSDVNGVQESTHPYPGRGDECAGHPV